MASLVTTYSSCMHCIHVSIPILQATYIIITKRPRRRAVKLPLCLLQYCSKTNMPTALRKQTFRRSKINIPCTMLVTTCMGTSPARKGAVGGTSRASTPNQVRPHFQPIPWALKSKMPLKLTSLAANTPEPRGPGCLFDYTLCERISLAADTNAEDAEDEILGPASSFSCLSPLKTDREIFTKKITMTKPQPADAAP